MTEDPEPTTRTIARRARSGPERVLLGEKPFTTVWRMVLLAAVVFALAGVLNWTLG